MPDMIIAISKCVITSFLIANEITLTDSFDENDPACVRQVGEHVIVTVCGKYRDSDRDLQCLWYEFTRFLRKHNELASALKLQPYNVDTYKGYKDEWTYIYFSVCT